MVSYNLFGKPGSGNAGNNLFQTAFMLGIKHKYGCEITLPHWKHQWAFKWGINTGEQAPSIEIKEPQYHYNPEFLDKYASDFKVNKVDVRGWFQSEKYWEHCKDAVREALTFTDEVMDAVKDRPRGIAISIRRGDYVDNPNYDLLPIEYYIGALNKHFPDWRERNLIIFSDGLDYCRLHFRALNNVHYADLDAIHQLAYMSLQEDFVISNSTFSWWGAYLSELNGIAKKIVRPSYLFAGELLKKSDFRDHYPERWEVYDHKVEKMDLRNVTFLIPVYYDHKDRKQNLELSVCMIQKAFDTNIIIIEQGGSQFKHMSMYSKYIPFEGDIFHRTKMLNDMAQMADTPLIVNWDADMVISPVQILEAVHRLENGADMVYPYDGRFARVPRKEWFPVIEKHLDCGMFGDKKFFGMIPPYKASVGGAIFFNKASFLKGGGENENFLSYGREDVERRIRFENLGFNVQRVKGVIYHIDHHVGLNSSTTHPWYEGNEREYDKVAKMSTEELWEYVKTWSDEK